MGIRIGVSQNPLNRLETEAFDILHRRDPVVGVEGAEQGARAGTRRFGEIEK